MKTFKDIQPVPGYEHLEHILVAAYEQAAKGKGAERHANDKPFGEQPMQTIAQSYNSVDGLMFQVSKKLQESRGLPDGRAQAEVLGAIVYSAGVHLAYDTWARRDADKKTVSAPDGKKALEKPIVESMPLDSFKRLDTNDQKTEIACDNDFWIKWNGGDCPVGEDVWVRYICRCGLIAIQRAGRLLWKHLLSGGDIIAYKLVPTGGENEISN